MHSSRFDLQLFQPAALPAYLPVYLALAELARHGRLGRVRIESVGSDDAVCEALLAADTREEEIMTVGILEPAAAVRLACGECRPPGRAKFLPLIDERLTWLLRRNFSGDAGPRSTVPTVKTLGRAIADLHSRAQRPVAIVGPGVGTTLYRRVRSDQDMMSMVPGGVLKYYEYDLHELVRDPELALRYAEERTHGRSIVLLLTPDGLAAAARHTLSTEARLPPEPYPFTCVAILWGRLAPSSAVYEIESSLDHRLSEFRQYATGFDDKARENLQLLSGLIPGEARTDIERLGQAVSDVSSEIVHVSPFSITRATLWAQFRQAAGGDDDATTTPCSHPTSKRPSHRLFYEMYGQELLELFVRNATAPEVVSLLQRRSDAQSFLRELAELLAKESIP